MEIHDLNVKGVDIRVIVELDKSIVTISEKGDDGWEPVKVIHIGPDGTITGLQVELPK